MRHFPTIGCLVFAAAMTDQDQDAHDEWQTRLYEVVYRLSVSLKELHETNPWPEYPVLEQAINTLATELWDRCFSQTEIRTAFEHAAADLPRYAAGEEIRA
jgi:hypothetical protein